MSDEEEKEVKTGKVETETRGRTSLQSVSPLEVAQVRQYAVLLSRASVGIGNIYAGARAIDVAAALYIVTADIHKKLGLGREAFIKAAGMAYDGCLDATCGHDHRPEQVRVQDKIDEVVDAIRGVDKTTFES